MTLMMMHKCYSGSRSSIGEDNDSVSRKFCHRRFH